MNRYTVVKPWVVKYPDPIVLAPGQQVVIDTARTEDNPDWQGWAWCRSQDKEGWVPLQALEVRTQAGPVVTALAREGYSARELGVAAGDVVEGDLITNGWLWCRMQGGIDYGWVPLVNLAKET
jgi:hypothetical protein